MHIWATAHPKRWLAGYLIGWGERRRPRWGKDGGRPGACAGPTLAPGSELLLSRASLGPSEPSCVFHHRDTEPPPPLRAQVTLHTCCARHADTQGEAHLLLRKGSRGQEMSSSAPHAGTGERGSVQRLTPGL